MYNDTYSYRERGFSFQGCLLKERMGLKPWLVPQVLWGMRGRSPGQLMTEGHGVGLADRVPAPAEPQDPTPALPLLASWAHVMPRAPGCPGLLFLGKDRSWHAPKARLPLGSGPSDRGGPPHRALSRHLR